MKKKIIWIVGLVVLLILLTTYWNQDKQKGERIKIGVVAPLQGGATVYGENLVKGMELAIKDLDKNIELIVEDDSGNPAKSASAAQKLINIDKVDAIVTITSGTGNAVAPVAEQAGVVHMCDCVDTSIAKNNGYLYSVLPEEEADKWLKEAQSRDIKNVSLIVQNHPGANLIAEEVKKGAEKYGVNLINIETIESSQRDFKTTVSKVKDENADMYFAIVFPPTLEILAREMKNQGISNFSSVGLLAISSDLTIFEDQWYTDNYLSDLGYQKRFEEEYPGTRFNVRSAPHGYDILTMFVKGLETGNLNEYMKNLYSYNGKAGKGIREEGTNIFKLPLAIWKIDDGKINMIQE